MKPDFFFGGVWFVPLWLGLTNRPPYRAVRTVRVFGFLLAAWEVR